MEIVPGTQNRDQRGDIITCRRYGSESVTKKYFDEMGAMTSEAVRVNEEDNR